MTRSTDPRNPDLASGSQYADYMVERIIPIDALQLIFYQLRHIPTGAGHIHISNTDSENVFGVTFKTVPADSTGVAHILEHTVLCGSAKFPVRDPFFAMLKRSLSTFMNAFTSSDWTMYPFATQNRKDYYNLMDVYLDAAFFPNIEELSFKQEGIRIEVTDRNEADQAPTLSYMGVVYNEMKGAMSSPDQVLGRSLLNALFPDTTYRFNSGGEPDDIPKLSYAQLCAFHQRHYHPSNAFFYTYGDLPLKDHLDFIAEKVLDRYKPIDPQTDVASQPRWESSRQAVYHYPLGPNEDPSQKYQVGLAWLTTDIRDTREVLALVLLEQILLGNAGSPLRRSLIESGIGSSLSDHTGLDPDYRDVLFTCGLKDVRETDVQTIEKLIMDSLGDLVVQGIEKKLIESALHQIEFKRKEVTNTPYPYGLKLLLGLVGTWIHDGDPLRILQFDQDLAAMRNDIEAGGFFEDVISRYLIDNPHRVRFILKPDQKLEESRKQKVAVELAQIGKQLTTRQIDDLQKQAAILKTQQEAQEDISVLPTLQRDDIPASVKVVKPTTNCTSNTLFCYEQPTAGIYYLSGAFGIGQLHARHLPLLSFFCHALPRTGTTRRDYTDLSGNIDLYTGGVGLAPQARMQYDEQGKCLPYISLAAKCLERNQVQMHELVNELLTDYAFTDLERLKNLILEYQAGLESMIVHNGHRLAMLLAARNHSAADALSETWHGVHQLQTIRALTQDLSNARLESLATDLTTIAELLFKRQNVRLAIIGEQQTLTKALPLAQDLSQSLKADGQDAFYFKAPVNGNGLPREGWSTASAVSFVAQTFPVVRLLHDDAPGLAVISKLLRSQYLHREIREKGGAYGGFALYSSESGLFAYASYRDPHITRTLETFQRISTFLSAEPYTEEEIKEAVLQICSEIDKPDPPGPAAKKAFHRQMVGLSDELRTRYKLALLNLSKADINAVVAKYFSAPSTRQAVAVISGQAQLDAANQELAGDPLKLRVI
jgi:Zn-dependent M16 (insulinase) family peptidase